MARRIALASLAVVTSFSTIAATAHASASGWSQAGPGGCCPHPIANDGGEWDRIGNP